MLRQFSDAMAITSQVGSPSIFITMTFNVKCREMTENLKPGQTSYDRPDLVTRFFLFHLFISTENKIHFA